MRGPSLRYPLSAVVGMAVLALSAAGPNPAWSQTPNSQTPQTSARDGIHLGVASCAGSTCHGAIERLKGSSVPQNEYITWTRRDKHAKAYSVLFDERSKRIARNLGLPDAHTAQICLDCHADNAPPDKRGRQFQISDGVGCEACHGAASGWLGIHISGAAHRDNVAAGLYPTDQPLARAEKCLGCHLGDDKRYVTHKIMGAGHPRMIFELDTFTAVQPAHFVVDKSYIERKGAVNDVQVWAVGQAVAVSRFMDEVLDPKRGPSGIFPELALFDCQACHHGIKEAKWEPRSSTGLGPGTVRLYDANVIMLRVIAQRVAPATAKTLSEQLLALHKATTENWGAVQRQAREVKKTASDLVAVLGRHEFGRDDITALADALIRGGLTGGDEVDYSNAEQATMALASVVSALKQGGYVSDSQKTSLGDSVNKLYEAVATNEGFRPEGFKLALRDFQQALPAH